MRQSTNVLSFISPHGGEGASKEGVSRNGTPEPVRRSRESETADTMRRIAEAALSATDASGAALALRSEGLQRDAVIVCMARAGEMAPPLGAKLDSSSGISGECLRTGQALRCDDTEIDARVDRQACRALGLRSLAIAPVKDGDEVVGILEVFSAQPDAFTSRHLDVLRQLAELVLDDFETPEDPAERPSGLSLSPAVVEAATPPAVVARPSIPEVPRVEEKAAEAVVPKISAAAASSVPFLEHAIIERAFPATPTPSDVNIAAYMAAEEASHSQTDRRIPFVFLIGLAVILIGSAASLAVWRRMSMETQEAARPKSSQVALASTSSGSTPAGGASGVLPVPTPGTTASGTMPVNAEVPREESQPGQVSNSPGSHPALTNASARDVVHTVSTSRASAYPADVTKPIRVVGTSDPKSIGNQDADVAPALEAAMGGPGSQVLSSMLNVPASLPGRETPISQGVQGGELEHRISPVYPVQARSMRQQGTVVLNAVIAENGTVRDLKVVSGPPMLAQAATDAVKQWRYKPFRLNGKPVSMQTQVKVEFKLP